MYVIAFAWPGCVTQRELNEVSARRCVSSRAGSTSPRSCAIVLGAGVGEGVARGVGVGVGVGAVVALDVAVARDRVATGVGAVVTTGEQALTSATRARLSAASRPTCSG